MKIKIIEINTGLINGITYDFNWNRIFKVSAFSGCSILNFLLQSYEYSHNLPVEMDFDTLENLGAVRAALTSWEIFLRIWYAPKNQA